MKIAMAFVADEANISREGKLNVLGVFDRIASPQFPVLHPKMVFAFRIAAEFGDGGVPMPVRIRLVDADGGVLFETSGEIVAPTVGPGEFATTHQVFNLLGIQFPAPGIYSFIVNLGELPPYETPLSVVQTPWNAGNTQDAN